jgi:N-acetylmuramoyl-L-alanine amidase
LSGGERCFPDVDQEEWYAPYLCYAKTNNIIKGYPDGSAKPDNSVTIAEALKIALNTFDTKTQEGE